MHARNKRKPINSGESTPRLAMSQPYLTAEVIDRIGKEFQAGVPCINGFSGTNIYRTGVFYLAYWNQLAIVPQPGGQMADDAVPPHV